MKAAGSIGANSPLRLRLLVMTCDTPTPTSASAGVPATKFGIAIGSGVNSPPVTGTRVCARARGALPRISPLEASPDKTCRRFMRNGASVSSYFLDIVHFALNSRAALQVFAVEIRD